MAAPRTPYLSKVKVITQSTGTLALTPYDSGFIVMANTATMAVTLPSVASSEGVRFQFVKTSASTTAITLKGPATTEKINGATSYASMDAAYDSVEIFCTGSEWLVADQKIA